MIDSLIKRRPKIKEIDFRSKWTESRELRDSVRRILSDWGDAVRGGFPPLGYPTKEPFAITPEKGGVTYDPDEVQLVSDTMMLWHLIQRYIGDEDIKAQMIRLFTIIRVEFVCSGIPQEVKAKKFKIGRRQYVRLLNEALYRFWVLYQ